MEESKVEGEGMEITVDPLAPSPLGLENVLLTGACILCAKDSGDGEGTEGGDLKKCFGRFLREVLELDKEEEKNLKRNSLEVIESLRVCGGCGDVIKGVVEGKEGVKEVEKRVKELQREIEEEKRKLEKRMEQFWVEMRRMKEIVNGSEGNMGSLEETPVGVGKRMVEGFKKEGKSLEETGGKVKEKMEGGQEVDAEMENPNVAAKILRDSILFFAQDLQEKQSAKKNTRRKSKRLKTRGRKRYFGNGGEVVDNILMPLVESVKVENQMGGEAEGISGGIGGAKQRQAKSTKLLAGSGGVEGSTLGFPILDEIKEEPVDKQSEDLDDSLILQHQTTEHPELPPIFPDEDDDGDDFELEIISERFKRKRKIGGDGNEVDENNMDNLSDTGSLHDHFSDTSDTDFNLDEDDELMGSESESSSSSSSSTNEKSEDDNDDGENYGRKSKKKRKDKKTKKEKLVDDTSKKRRKSAYTKAMSTINFHKMSKLKRKLIQRIIHKKFRRPTRKPKTPGKLEVADPRLLHFMEYDNLGDTLTLEGVPIYIHESKEDEEDVIILECGECGWRAKPAHNSRHPVDSFMYNHVAGQHLNLFQCVQCGSNLGGFKQYSDHVLGHRMGFACDVCGRPLGGAQALARHKWSHLNEEEALELVKKGLKDPREKKESTKCWTCGNCGKIFPQRCQLRKHEKVHLEVRERITCEICGKLFLPSGFISHKRYYCFAEGVEQPRISCPVCPKVFKNKQFMQVHMDRAHNEERRHKCDKCGKGFKTKKDLMTHEETHTTERAFGCKKGCGRTYKTRKNCNAHEKRCDGRGGILIQRFLDAGDERPFSCRKGCGRAYKTRRTLRGHEKTCQGTSFVGDVGGGGGVGGVVLGGGGDSGSVGGGVVVTPMTVLGAALQASMDVSGGEGGSGIQHGEQIVLVGEGGRLSTATVTIVETVPIAVATETVVTRNDY